MSRPIFFDLETKNTLIRFTAAAEESSATLIRLTKWLIGFTIALVLLTIVIVVLTPLPARKTLPVLAPGNFPPTRANA